MFDRDYTVNVNPHPDKKAVPLKWVKWLARETDNIVFATGNQHLRREALIPGMKEAISIWEDMNGYSPEREYEGEEYWDEFRPTRREGIHIVKDIHPNENEFVVIDDVDLTDMTEFGIKHYYPWDFYYKVVNGVFPIPLDGGEQDDQPENARDREVGEWLNSMNFFDEYAHI